MLREIADALGPFFLKIVAAAAAIVGFAPLVVALLALLFV